MDDLDQVRATLGYEKINLYGASYGTRAALAYLRQHPDRVRTVILDGVAPPNWTLGPAAAGDGQRALQMLFARCLAEAGCRQAFPNIQTEFQSVLGELQTQGIEVNLDHPVTGAPTMVTLTRDQFTSTIHLMSYTPETAALIPLMIHAAFERQDFRPLAAQALTSFDTVESSLSNGMRFSVVCAEDVPFYAQEFPSQGYLGDYIMESFIKICEMWPRGEIPADFKQPVRSDIPVLLLSGEADPVTPPSNGELTAKTLSNYEHLVVPGMGHINIFRGCIPRIAAAFVDIGSTQGLDTACVENISPMPFFMNFSGSTP
jgi:pimeloyl-ACP methyl ester carboxylesterase